MGPSLPAHTEESAHASGYSPPLLCLLLGAIHCKSCPSAPALPLGWALIRASIHCLGVCSIGVTCKTVIKLVFWEPWHLAPPALCPTHISTSSSLWNAARPSWAPLPVVFGWQSVALCVLVGIWDLGRQMALELELKPFQQCHSDFRLLLPCG